MCISFLLGTLEIMLSIGLASMTLDSQIVMHSSLFFNLMRV